MKKSLVKFVEKLQHTRSKKLEGGFKVIFKLRGGVGSVNDYCSGTNPSACSNQRECSGTTNTIGCHNYGTCFD
jgi:hypothetical protein